MGFRVAGYWPDAALFRSRLAIDAGRPLTLDEAASLADEFSESDLSYRVDVVDWRAIDDRFRQIIARERVPLAEKVGVTR
ncbi:MAG TPA: hypothetical protein VIM52_17655 [Stellaceae bacterium]